MGNACTNRRASKEPAPPSPPTPPAHPNHELVATQLVPDDAGPLPARAVIAFSDFVDSYNDVAGEVSGDRAVTAFVSAATAVLRGVPGVVAVLAGFGEHAPLIGVAFSVLKAAAERATATSDLRTKLLQSAEEVVAFATLTANMEGDFMVHHGQDLNEDAVRSALGNFRQQLSALAALVLDHTGRGWLSRFCSNPTTTSELIRVCGRIEGGQKRLLIALGAHNASALRVLLQNSSVQRAAFRAIDYLQYASAINAKFGHMREDAGTLGGHAALLEHHNLSLDAVYVDQDVLRFDEYDPTVAEIREQLVHTHRAAAARQTRFVKLIARVEQRAASMQCEQLSLSQLLANSSTPQALVVLGEPGAGKSSGLRMRALQWAAAVREQPCPASLNILIEAKHYAHDLERQTGLTLVDYLVGGGTVLHPLNKLALLAHLASTLAPTLLMVDALDEVIDSTQRNSVLDRIKQFHTEFAATSTRVVVTSRIVGYDTALNAHSFAHFVLRPLTMPQTLEFIDKWHIQTYSNADAELRRRHQSRLQAAIDHNPSVRSLVSNPLLLTMMAMVNRTEDIPTRRFALYKSCCHLLLARWHADAWVRRRGRNDATADRLEVFDLAVKEEILRQVVLVVHERPDPSYWIHEDVLKRVLGAHVSKLFTVPEPQIVNRLIQQFRDRHGILCWLGDVWFLFAHQSFHEYFLAWALFKEWAGGRLSKTDLLGLFRQPTPQGAGVEVLCGLCAQLPPKDVAACLDVLCDEGAIFVAAKCIEQLEDREPCVEQVTHIRSQMEAKFTRVDRRYDGLHHLPLYSRIWRDNRARALFVDTVSSTEHMLQDDAVTCLAQGWGRHASTRAILVDAALRPNLSISPTTFNVLLNLWSDGPSAERLVLHIAKSDSNVAPTAVRLLVGSTVDDRAKQQLLEQVASLEKAGSAEALLALDRLCPNEPYRQRRLEQLARSNATGAAAAVRHFANDWPTPPAARRLLEDVALSGTHGAKTAFQHLLLELECEPDIEQAVSIKQSMHRIAKSDNETAVDAVQAIVRHSLLDDATKQFLEEVAQSDTRGSIAALIELVTFWPETAVALQRLELIAHADTSDALTAVYAIAKLDPIMFDPSFVKRILGHLAQANTRGATAASLQFYQRWPDDPVSLQLLRQAALADTPEAQDVVEEVANRLGHDASAKQLLEEIAEADKLGAKKAVMQLTYRCANDQCVAALMRKLAQSDAQVAPAALYALAFQWTEDASTKDLLQQVARSDSPLAAAAVKYIVYFEPDESSIYALLKKVAQLNQAGAATAVKYLVVGWSGDEATRQLLQGLAQPEHPFARKHLSAPSAEGELIRDLLDCVRSGS